MIIKHTKRDLISIKTNWKYGPNFFNKNLRTIVQIRLEKKTTHCYAFQFTTIQ
jgi:hypothetical protein